MNVINKRIKQCLLTLGVITLMFTHTLPATAQPKMNCADAKGFKEMQKELDMVLLGIYKAGTEENLLMFRDKDGAIHVVQPLQEGKIMCLVVLFESDSTQS